MPVSHLHDSLKVNPATLSIEPALLLIEATGRGFFFAKYAGVNSSAEGLSFLQHQRVLFDPRTNTAFPESTADSSPGSARIYCNALSIVFEVTGKSLAGEKISYGIYPEEPQAILSVASMRASMPRERSNKDSLAEDRFDAAWEAEGFSILCTGGEFWGAFKQFGGFDFLVTDAEESRTIDPEGKLNVGAYSLEGDWLDFIREASSIKDVNEKIERWARELSALCAPATAASGH